MSSRRKEALSWLSVVFVLLIVGAAAVYILWPQTQPRATVRIGDGVFKAAVARTDEARTQGLSGSEALREDEALLLIYGDDEKWSIWMKDMNYPIDIVWLDKNKEVVHIVKNAPPDSYPQEQFTSKKVARYVLELPAGTVAAKSITIGSAAAFDENNIGGGAA